MQNVLLPSYPFGLFVAPTAGGTGFNSAGGFGSGRMGAGSFADHQPAPRAFNPLGSTGIGRRQPSISPLYSPRNASAHGLPGGYTGFAVSPGALTSLNQMLRGSFNLPLNSSAGSFRFTYQNVLRPGVSLAGLDHPSASLMFSTSGLGNGMVFSAGTSYGSHSLPSTPAANLGAVPAADPKHSGPTVNLKLSF